MCGIAGILNIENQESVSEAEIRKMLALIRHRGPDEFGIYLEDTVGLGSARLAVVDLKLGQQPISNEDGSMWIVFNGEIFNYVELRLELEAKGHRFATTSDTEVLLHMFEQYGPECLERLNGQFAFAIWNARTQRLFLARDRLGVRPCFYTLCHGRLIFASEIKAIVAAGVSAEIDPAVLHEVFTYWCPLSPRTVFKGILELPPGHYLSFDQGKLSLVSYWELNFPAQREFQDKNCTPIDEIVEAFEHLLIEATKIRLRADVPVGAYLSGGLDSSIIASVIHNFTGNHLDTFSITFDDENFDESAWQLRMASFLGTNHHVVRTSHEDIARIFPKVIWHAEVPLLRTSPAPMFMLSKLVRDTGYKVVLTGEGADEFLAGYDIFKEAKVRRFWARQPDSRLRPRLLRRLYPDIPRVGKNQLSLLAAFFREGLQDIDSPGYSHALRWRNARRVKRFFNTEVQSVIRENEMRNASEVLPADSSNWPPLSRAQYLEIKIFLSQYLLSSQGDRMAMAHSVEGRFPFLDCRVVSFCNRLPPEMKLHGLAEKFILKKLGRKWLPPEIWRRSKRPYRAPIHRCFFNGLSCDYVNDLLSPQKLASYGYFEPQTVVNLVTKIRGGHSLGETDDMALAGIISTQLLHHQFVEHFDADVDLSDHERVKVQTSGAALTGKRSNDIRIASQCDTTR